MKNGEIRYENYFDGQSSRTRHLVMSVSKSLTGILATFLVAEGKLNRDAKVMDYIPELKGAAPELKNDHGPRTIRQFLTSLKKQRKHGDKFHYVTPTTDVLCWLTERASGETFETLLSDRLWSKLGMSRGAFVLVDKSGTSSCGGGVNATAIDLAKVGVMLLNKGEFNGKKSCRTRP
ncbi:serine hydrolase domain-containing protein [Serratia plymuthica]|uniref:serine hydrolase domain-containing protein n=1 Tax=Serratia plymuthica TaxID=82996 RepID=UPI0028DCFFF6|nr:serine hydrolase [Serratia plymuthica]